MREGSPPRGPHVPLVLAITFLTPIPIPLAGVATKRQLAAALSYFPLVGAGIGAVVGGLDQVWVRLWPPSVAAALDIGALALLSGGLHLDALMDTCDGLFGGRTVERRLEIMRDSRVGSFGVIAGVLALLTQFAALAALPDSGRFFAFVAAAAAARWAMVAAILAFPPARPDGLGATFRQEARPLALLAATFIAALAVAPLRLAGGVVLLAAALLCWLLGAYICRQVRGLTGDSYGAIGELVTTVAFVALLALRR